MRSIAFVTMFFLPGTFLAVSWQLKLNAESGLVKWQMLI